MGLISNAPGSGIGIVLSTYRRLASADQNHVNDRDENQGTCAPHRPPTLLANPECRRCQALPERQGFWGRRPEGPGPMIHPQQY